MYRHLDSQKIVSTAQALRNRIQERFPGSGLGKLSEELLRVSNEAVERTSWIQKPHLPLRAGMLLLVAAMIAIFLSMLANLDLPHLQDWANFIQVLEAALSAVFFIGAAILFLFNIRELLRHDFDFAFGGVIRKLHPVRGRRQAGNVLFLHQFIQILGKASFLRVEKLDVLLEGRRIDGFLGDGFGFGNCSQVIDRSGDWIPAGGRGIGWCRRRGCLLFAATN